MRLRKNVEYALIVASLNLERTKPMNTNIPQDDELDMFELTWITPKYQFYLPYDDEFGNLGRQFKLAAWDIWQSARQSARQADNKKQAQPCGWITKRDDVIEAMGTMYITNAHKNSLHEGEQVVGALFDIPVYLAAPQQAIPSGWKLVPIEPTEEMLAEIHLIDSFSLEALKARYEAMLSASPTAPIESDKFRNLIPAQQTQGKSLIAFAVNRWRAEVFNRPMANVHRRTLDDTWRQVIRFAGGDPEKLIGKSHDELLAAPTPDNGSE